jgi:hypothetical protein
LERNEPSAWEKIRTGQVIPPTERGLDIEGPVDIRDVLITLGQGYNIVGDRGAVDAPDHITGENKAEKAADISGLFIRSARLEYSFSILDRISRRWRSCDPSITL